MNELRLRMEAILDELVEVEAIVASACARRARLLAEATSIRLAEAAQPAQGVAMRSLVGEISCETHVAESTVLRQINDAETLTRSLPGTLCALSEGTISYRHAQSMVAHAVSLPEEARPAFEAHLLPTARANPPAAFDRVARRERERMHPESIETRSASAREQRHVRLQSDIDGMAWLSCYLPAVAALAIDDRLDRAARAARSPQEQRTHRQLRVDAAVALLLGSGPNDPAGASGIAADGQVPAKVPALGGLAAAIVPTVILTVPVLSLLGQEGGLADLHGHGPIDLDSARALCARAPSFLRILTHPETGETVSVGRTRYHPPADLKLGLLVADQYCRFPGCGRRAARCELDHAEDWARGGETSRANLHHLCAKHHHLKHDGSGWSVSASPGRQLDWTSPTGRSYRTSPYPVAKPQDRKPRFVALRQ